MEARATYIAKDTLRDYFDSRYSHPAPGLEMSEADTQAVLASIKRAQKIAEELDRRVDPDSLNRPFTL